VVVQGPWWVAPLIAIPAGPACAALSHTARRVSRGLTVDRAHFMAAFRRYWRPALAANAAGLGILSLLLLNLVFYFGRTDPFLQAFSVLWLFLTVFWVGVLVYLFPVLVGQEQPRPGAALRTAALLALGNPLFTALLVAIGVLFTAASGAVFLLLIFVWPALLALMGEHALRLFMVRAGLPLDEDVGALPPERPGRSGSRE